MSASLPSDQAAPHTGFVPVRNAKLYYRELGQGLPIIVIHGGPDFDHTYLLPDMDRLSDSYRLIYYDQRGRGRSAEHVKPEDVTLQSDVEDLESLRDYFQLGSAAVVGHSWGGLLALEYALRYPQRVSHLILMNSAPVSCADYLLLRQDRRATAPADLEELKARSTEASYQEGDPDAVAAYYRIHFRATLKQTEHLEKVIQSLRASFTKEGIRKARAIEKRLMHETWWSNEYDLLPKLKRLNIPTLVIYAEYEFIPVECALHIAKAIPGARCVSLRKCGHFSYLECPDQVRREIDDFFANS
ncbi:MAG TPA: alpha/beta hydrolase [Anaerolineales bacterium]|nr:alpha/beta hydrolase [Anaerolineales bacterium]